MYNLVLPLVMVLFLIVLTVWLLSQRKSLTGSLQICELDAVFTREFGFYSAQPHTSIVGTNFDGTSQTESGFIWKHTERNCIIFANVRHATEKVTVANRATVLTIQNSWNELDSWVESLPWRDVCELDEYTSYTA